METRRLRSYILCLQYSGTTFINCYIYKWVDIKLLTTVLLRPNKSTNKSSLSFIYSFIFYNFKQLKSIYSHVKKEVFTGLYKVLHKEPPLAAMI